MHGKAYVTPKFLAKQPKVAAELSLKIPPQSRQTRTTLNGAINITFDLIDFRMMAPLILHLI
jgi:hypothetical protein